MDVLGSARPAAETHHEVLADDIKVSQEDGSIKT